VQEARRSAALELVLVSLALSTGCHNAQRHASPSPGARASTTPFAPVVRDSGRFLCEGDTCRQLHPHLPDTGEWRCAESLDGVWCAGGQPAAGVVAGAPDSDFACSARWGDKTGERVCIDRHPTYPGEPRDYRCNFEQERGMTRVCRRTPPNGRAAPPRYALRSPACWLDHDCPAGHCRAGACECRSNADCSKGSCNLAGLCEAGP
jgi:hypothetical protein